MSNPTSVRSPAMKSDIPYTIRAARIDDLLLVSVLIQPSVRQRKLLPRTNDELAKLIPHGFVAESQGHMVGFAAVEIYSRKLAEIQCLAVAEDYREQGIGSALIDCCIQRAQEMGVLELMAITASEGLFQKSGFDYSLPGQKKALFISPQRLRRKRS